jgi:aspartyl-tRNA(Asn)/glutamyl-tRNA(Gln) amidotransferase subunit A
VRHHNSQHPLTFALSSFSYYESYFIKAQLLRETLRDDFNRVFRTPHPMDRANYSCDSEQVDVLLTPASLSSAPGLDDVSHQSTDSTAASMGYVNDVMTVPASLAGTIHRWMLS